jgi:hypothetical protein
MSYEGRRDREAGARPGGGTLVDSGGVPGKTTLVEQLQQGGGVGDTAATNHGPSGLPWLPYLALGQGGQSAAAPAASATTSEIAPPIGGVNETGFIDNSDGANLRTGPAEAGGKTVIDGPLPPATRVFVSGTHPSAPQWWYVTAFLPDKIVRGYVQHFRVNTELPEPLAKLHQVKSGDTAEGLAVKEYKSSVRDGHDLRYYENVLLHVNKQHGRAGITGSYQEPGLLGGGANNVQLVAGHRIWLVSPAYAKALEGVVPDGSLTNGVYAKVKRFVQHVIDIIKSVTGSPQFFGEVAGEYAQAIRDHLPEIIGIVAGFIAAEAASAFLAATPTGVGQAAAVVIQLALAAFGAAGLVETAVQALKHAGEWLTLAWTANGKDAQIAEASREFLRMLVALAMAALSAIGVKGNYGKAMKIAQSMPPAGLVPAFATAGGPSIPGPTATAGAGVKLGVPGPAGPVGTAAGMKMEGKEEGGGGSDKDAKKGARDAAKGTTATRQERLAELSKDPDRGGNPTETGRREAEVILALEDQGKVPGPVRRPERGDGHSGDFVDSTHVDWDVKAPKSRSTLLEEIAKENASKGRKPPNPSRRVAGEFDLSTTIESVRREIQNRERVAIDLRGLTLEDRAALKKRLLKANLEAKVVYYE